MIDSMELTKKEVEHLKRIVAPIIKTVCKSKNPELQVDIASEAIVKLMGQVRLQGMNKLIQNNIEVDSGQET